ncbi:peroxisomal membrane protein 11A-like protein [Cinnamomum micranthum f. kanehirae]|uniref:Peroxisomal membrane protein 11A-like protein n=1 Tax=Cinnamomum micranthum f. kanehirae TaxID=337451 RepID=A0A3S4PBM9_9MAGN|nr:peroxisomal membrane protein 11A-like protein [Cinnamomum micranthum f. kanehirae]
MHLKSYIAKRDDVGKLFKISRYTAKIALSSSLLPQTSPLHPLNPASASPVRPSASTKFVQDLNALRAHHPISLSSPSSPTEG